MKTPLPAWPSRAFSLVEVIAAVAIIGILAAAAVQFAIDANHLRQNKLESDVRTLNTAVKVYLASGGSLAGVTGAGQVIEKLKTVRNRSTASLYAGFRGSMLDARFNPVFQTEAESASGQPRVLWNPGKRAFEIVTSGPGGISHFAWDAKAGARDSGEEERARGAVDYNLETGWIWAYRDSPGTKPASPSLVSVAPANPGGIPAGAPAPQRLAPPQFATPPGTYDYPAFPGIVSITNPNPEGSSALYFATVWDGSGIQWQPYTGPVPVQPGTQVLARARPLSSAFADSFTVGGVFVRNTFPLRAPEIAVSAPCLNLESNDPVTIELIDRNPPFAIHRLEYSVNGGEFCAYSDPLPISPATYASGFAVVARSTPLAPGFAPSPEVSQTLNLKLRTPEIAVGNPAPPGNSSAIPVTLSNPNPDGSSIVLYTVRNEATGETSSLQTYREPFPIPQSDYPKGFTVWAHASPILANYLESDRARQFVPIFFGLPVLGSTIFVLDTSGSMNSFDALLKVQAEMLKVLGQLTAQESFALVRFSTGAEILAPFRQATSTAVAAGTSALSGLQATGWTNYSAALDLALEIAKDREVRQVIFLSDGHPTRGDTSTQGILSRVRQIVAQGTQVNVLGYGQLNPPEQELISLMNETGRPG